MTPRTDAEETRYFDTNDRIGVVSADFARQLEKQMDRLLKVLGELLDAEAGYLRSCHHDQAYDLARSTLEEVKAEITRAARAGSPAGSPSASAE